MADQIVPKDDLPGELVPQSDLPDEGPTYDPRSQVPRALGAGAGAVAGAVISPLAQAGVNRVKQARAGKLPGVVAAHPNEMVPKTSVIDEALNKGFSNAITQHTREAQISQREKDVAKTLAELKAKGVPVNPNILANMQTQAAMPGGSILINADTAKKIEAEEAVRKTAALPKKPLVQRVISGWEAPKLPSNILGNAGHFLQGVSEYKLPFIGGLGLLAGRILGGAGAFSQGVDAFNRNEQGDTTGPWISGLGGVGTGISVLPFPPPIRALGFGAGLSAEAINAYRDAMARGNIIHGAPQAYENTDPMGSQYAQGGLVYLAGGGQPNVQQIQSNISPQEQAIVDYHRNTIASGNIGRDDHNNPVTVYSNTVDIPSGLYAGKVATVPGYYDNQIHNDPREIYAKWAEQIDQGKWPIYYDPRTGDTRAKYIHGIMDQEKPK